MRGVTGLANFRDMGGLPAWHGRIRSDVLYRSEAPTSLPPESLKMLERSPLALILDLRTDAERAAAPDPTIPGVVVRAFPLQGGDMRSQFERVLVGMPPDRLAATVAAFDAPVFLRGLYRGMILDEPAALAAAATEASRLDPGKAMLVHCTAGKDRTGVLVALMLRVAGVDADDVVADYARSQGNLRGRWEEGMLHAIASLGVVLPENVRPVLTASPASLMRETLELVDARFGSAAGYFAANGMQVDDLRRLRRLLVEPDGTGALR